LKSEFPLLTSLKQLFVQLAIIGCKLQTRTCIKYDSTSTFHQEYWKFTNIKFQRGFRLKQKEGKKSKFTNISIILSVAVMDERNNNVFWHS
jgi:hypothetical protein